MIYVCLLFVLIDWELLKVSEYFEFYNCCIAIAACSVLANYLPIDKRHLGGSDDHDMAEAIVLTKSTTNAVVDKVRSLDK